MTKVEMPVANVLPADLLSSENLPIPDGIVGSRIVAFGTIPGLKAEGGGLVIDYIPEGKSATRRVVLAFNELGMWIEHTFLYEVV